jgi:hypothetical protein
LCSETTMEPPTPSRYAEWYAKNREHALAYKREYYKTHPEYAQRKKQLAKNRYHASKSATTTTVPTVTH